jgi:hypothetical protein
MHEVWNTVVVRDLAWLMVTAALLILLYAAGIRFEQDRQSIEHLQVKIDQIEARLNKDKEVDSFLRALEASGKFKK